MEVAMTSATPRTDFLGVDEDMEISSEAGRGQESDIEIFDLEEDNTTNAMDDDMVDDNGNDEKDEEMGDEYARENTVDMDDEIVFDEDVEITEGAEVGTHNHAQDRSVAPQENQQHLEQFPAISVGQIPAAEQQISPSVTEIFVPRISDDEDKPAADETRPQKTIVGTAILEAENAGGNGEARSNEQETDTTNAVQSEVPSTLLSQLHDGEESQVVPTPSQDADSAQQTVAEHATHASISHEVKIFYENTEMCLFPPNDPQDSRTYLLQDTSLLQSPIKELFPACRIVLADSIGEKDELHIEIPDLRLRIGERTSERPAATLSDVIDVYLALSYNDSSDEPGPLYLNLEVVTDFQSRLDNLHDLASEGKGFSSIIEPIDTSDEEDWPEEDADSVAAVVVSGAVCDDVAVKDEKHSQPSPPPGNVTGELNADGPLVNAANTNTHGGERQVTSADTTDHTASHSQKDESDSSDVSATVQGEAVSAEDLATREVQSTEESLLSVQAQESANLSEQHIQNDEFVFDLSTDNDRNINENEITNAAETSQTRKSQSESEPLIPNAKNMLSAMDVSTKSSNQVTVGGASYQTPNPRIDRKAEGTDTSQKRNSRQELSSEEVQTSGNLEAVAKNSAAQHTPTTEPQINIQATETELEGETLAPPEDDDVIDFSEDDELSTAVSPSTSHKRSREEFDDITDSLDTGGDTKKVKA